MDKKVNYKNLPDKHIDTSSSSITQVPNQSSKSIENQQHFLSENSIYIYDNPRQKNFPDVPPNTPKEFTSACYVTILPTIPESVEHIFIPYVRECGVRDSIDALAKYFNCENYRNNLIQFWFMDIIVDCLWKAQDEYRFNVEQQKSVLSWVLFIFRLIKEYNITKNCLVKIFNEAIMIAEEYILTGTTDPPYPNKLFTSVNKSVGETKSVQSIVSLQSQRKCLESLGDLRPSQHYLAIKYESEVQIFKIPNKMGDECLSSTVEPPSEDGFLTEESDERNENKSENSSSDFSLDFYKPDMSTPPRFKSLQQLEKETKVESEDSKEEIKQSKDEKAFWIKVPRKKPIPKCPSKLITKTEEVTSFVSVNKNPTEPNKVNQEEISTTETKESRISEVVLTNEEILKAFYEYNLWLLKNEYMADPEVGWSSLTKIKSEYPTADKKDTLKNKRKPINVDENQKNILNNIEKNIFVNSCILMAVKQMVFDYFYDTFTFELLRISLKSPQYLITQDLNDEWHIPKEFMGDFKIPNPKKPKKEKPKKEKKKKEKKDKSSKKSNKSKDSKKSKKSKDKGSKKDKKSKTSQKSAKKDKKLTKEEKHELERQRKEQEELEKARMKEEQQKRFMFPLNEAVDDKFFAKIFANFKGRKPAKDGKSSKSSKSSKGSKSGKGSKKSSKGKKKK